MLFSKSIIATLLVALASSLSGAPIPVRTGQLSEGVTASELHVRTSPSKNAPVPEHTTCQPPTPAQFEKGMIHPKPNTSLFYSSPKGESYETRVRECAKHHGLVCLLQLVDVPVFKKRREACEKEGWKSPGNLKFWRNASQVFARWTSGIAYIMLKPGVTPWEKSIWVTVEAPILKKKGITVKRINPDTKDLKTAPVYSLDDIRDLEVIKDIKSV